MDIQELFYIYNSIEKMFPQDKKSENNVIMNNMDCETKEKSTNPSVVEKKLDIIVTWLQNDWGMYCRPAEALARVLAKHPKVNKVIYLEPPVNLDAVHQGQYKDIDPNLANRIGEHIIEEGVITFVPYYRGNMNEETISNIAIQIKKLLVGKSISNPVTFIYFSNEWSKFFYDLLKPISSLTVEWMADDLSKLNLPQDARQKYRAIREYLGKSCDLIITNANGLKEFSKLNRNTFYIPQGYDLTWEEIFNRGELELPEPVDLQDIPSPRIIYVGALSVRIDLKLLGYIAKSNSSWNIVLIGFAPSSELLKLIKQFNNIYYLGPKKYNEVPYYLLNSEVCILPHIVDEFTTTVEPQKMFNYLAAGKPVVSTPCAGVEKFKDFITIASTYNEFVEAINFWLKNDSKEYCLKRREAVKEYSWFNIGNKIMDLVENSLKTLEANKVSNPAYYSYSRPEIQALIPSSAKKILDIGCGTGELGKALKERQDCEVTGVEIVPEVADKARENLDKVIVGDIEEIIDDLPENYYDVVIFADVLEHLKNPWKILSQIKTRINAQSIVIISIPNVRHWSVIKDLLEGRWDYQEAGILDKTHLRFFTKKTILDMLDKTGFKATNLQGAILQGVEVPPSFLHALKTLGMEVSTLEEEGRIYQYLLVAQPKKVTPKTLSLTSIIILTRNNLEYTKMCLESIRRYTPEPHEIIVVDNGSTDGTIEYLETQEDVKLIKNGLNLGFALGNNLGLREARGEYIVILNNDTLVTEGWLTRLINSAQSNPQVGIVGPRSNYVVGVQLVKNVPYGDNMDAMQEFARQWSLENSGRYEEALRVIGFCMLVKREVIEKIGGFDPYYEAGNFEDDDFCIRAQRAGFKIRIAHDVFIHHFGSKTFQSEKIDYRQVMLTNWERFKSKWGLPRELPIERGYPIYDLIQGGFDQDKHFVPLSIEPLSLEELRSQTYLSEFNTLTLRWFLSNFEPQDDVTLVIYHPEEKAEEEVAKAIQELGYDIDKTPDILLYYHPLPENKIPSLVAAVDKVVVDSDSSPFLIWAKYLNKEVVEIETALHEP
ncbi:MAG: glycosyltransferase [Atribacterales bacterium]